MSTLTVRDCMLPATLKLSPDMPVVAAARLLVTHKVAGAPVVADGKLVGWVSEIDCMDIVIQVAYYGQRLANVADIMKTEVASVKPDASAINIASTMKGAKPKLYPVVDDDGELIGVLSRTYILAALCNAIQPIK